MALIRCTECGHEVSDRAEACPKCGHPVKAHTFCMYCGKQMSDNLTYCPNCGASTDSSALEKNNQQDYDLYPAPKRKMPIWLIVLLVLLFWGLLFGIGYYFFKSKNSKDASSEKNRSEVVLDSLLADGAYKFKGSWNSKDHSAQRCKIEFEKVGRNLEKCAYTNLKYNTRIPLEGKLQGDSLHFVGENSGKELVINLRISAKGDSLTGEGIDYKHSGKTATLRLKISEITNEQDEVVEDVAVKEKKKKKKKTKYVDIPYDDYYVGGGDYNDYTESGDCGVSCGGDYKSGSTTYFSSPYDVIGHLAGMTFYESSSGGRLQIRQDGCYVNGQCMTGAPEVKNYTSTTAVIRASVIPSGTITFYVDAKKGTVRDSFGNKYH